jgi:ATP-dependent Clp protease ATP-binding subunit ClpB
LARAARALAEFLFEDEQAMIWTDMSEYMEKFSAQRLIGAPHGCVGHPRRNKPRRFGIRHEFAARRRIIAA